MDEHKKTDIEYDLADVIIGAPHDFFVEKDRFRLYPMTLAKMFLLKRYFDELDFSEENVRLNPYMEAVRLAEEHTEVCCRIIAVFTAPNTYKDLYDYDAIEKRFDRFKEKLSYEDIATMMVYVLTWDKTDALYRHIGLDKEAVRRATIMKVKKDDKNNISFGGLSLFGTFIGQLKEMGYSDDEILYEKGYCYLRMMIADKMTSVYLSDDELKSLPDEVGGTMIDANDPQAMDKLRGKLKNVDFE